MQKKSSKVKHSPGFNSAPKWNIHQLKLKCALKAIKAYATEECSRWNLGVLQKRLEHTQLKSAIAEIKVCLKNIWSAHKWKMQQLKLTWKAAELYTKWMVKDYIMKYVAEHAPCPKVYLLDLATYDSNM